MFEIALLQSCFQDKHVLDVKGELTTIYDCKWAGPTLFDVGEDAENKLLWHDFFSFPIAQDMDLQWLQRRTATSIKIDMAKLLDNCLSVVNMSRHDNIITHFMGNTPVHEILGVYDVFFY